MRKANTERRCCAAALLAGMLCIFALRAGAADTGGGLQDRVLVVYGNERDSKRVATYYMAKRGIPAGNVCKVSTSSPDQVDDEEFASAVKKPIRKCLDQIGKDKILYIVFSYGTPFLMGMKGQTYALDSFVADIWDEFLPFRGAEQQEIQPYLGRAQSQGGLYEPYVSLAAYREKPGAKRLYSVWRLDGKTPAIAAGLVDKAMEAEAHGLSGQACFDRRFGPEINGVADNSYGAGDWDIFRAAEFTRKAGFPVLEDTHEQEFGTAPAPLRCDGAALYAGWYSLNHYNDAFTWKTGAIGIHLDSASASNPRAGTNWAANALERGITITSGAVGEPYLDNLPHPDQAFLYLFQGANAGDALLRSTRMLKWMIQNIGDPLYRPFPNGAKTTTPFSRELVLALLPQMISGDATSGGVVAVSGNPLETEWKVDLKSERPDVVQVPPQVTIPAGASYVRFALTSKAVESDGVTVRVSATANGLNRSNTLVLYSVLAPLEVSPAKMKAGTNGTGTVVIRHAAPAGGMTVELSASNPGVVRVPKEVMVESGQSRATFPVSGQKVSAEASATITASYAGMARTAAVTVVP